MYIAYGNGLPAYAPYPSHLDDHLPLAFEFIIIYLVDHLTHGFDFIILMKVFINLTIVIVDFLAGFSLRNLHSESEVDSI